MSQDKVVDFTGETTAEMLPEKVLRAACEADLESVLIVGFDKNAKVYFAGSTSDVFKILWLLEKAKKQVMDW